MYSAGQTQNVQAPIDHVTSMICTTDLSQEEHAQCVQTLTDSYTQNRQEVPENLRAAFDTFVEAVPRMIISYCSSTHIQPEHGDRFLQLDDAITVANCVLRESSVKNFRIYLEGTWLTVPDYFDKMAYLLNGIQIMRCISLAAGDRGGPADMVDGVVDGMNCAVTPGPSNDDTESQDGQTFQLGDPTRTPPPAPNCREIRVRPAEIGGPADRAYGEPNDGIACVPLSSQDQDGSEHQVNDPTSSGRGGSNPWTQGAAVTTPPAFDSINSSICNEYLDDQTRNECTNKLADVYLPNWRRVPENLRPVFEGFAELFVFSLFQACTRTFATSEAAGQCMENGFDGQPFTVDIFGGYYTLTDLIIKMADVLSVTGSAGGDGGTPSAPTDVREPQWIFSNPWQ